MKRVLTLSKKKVFLLVAILGFGVLLYSLADRYLIEDVQVRLEGSTKKKSWKIPSLKSKVTFGDDFYESENVKIKIEKVVKGSGRDQITYFVADVKTKNSSYINTAFAKNTVGRNIYQYTSDIAKENNAILAVNGDNYTFRDDGILIRNGEVYRDKGVRTGMYFTAEGEMASYDETQTNAAELLKLNVEDTFSFGPVLVDDGIVKSGFGKFKVDTNLGNPRIGRINPRTGIGYIEKNHYIFIVVDGRRDGYSKGVTLNKFAEIFGEYGCMEAYNLDGGGSSTMVFMGKIVNKPSGNKERGVSDIIYINEAY